MGSHPGAQRLLGQEQVCHPLTNYTADISPQAQP